VERRRWRINVVDLSEDKKDLFCAVIAKRVKRL
jgi:hypothetical protein